jgi:hypothetical protein
MPHCLPKALTLAVAVDLAAASGCTSTLRGLRPEEAPIMQHAIFVHPDGTAIAPAVNQPGQKFSSDTAYQRYVGAIMNAIRADSTRRNGKHRILLRIHGGLNKINSSLDASLAMSKLMSEDRQSGYFPVFINWESGLLSSLKEHLLNTRRGEYYPTWSPLGAPLFPVYLSSDLAQGLARSPLTLARQARNFWTSPWRDDQSPFPDPGAPAAATIADFSRKTRPVDIADKREQTLAAPQVRARRDAAGHAAMASPKDELSVSRFGYHRSKIEALEHIGAALLYSLPPNLYALGYRHVVQGRSSNGLSPGWAEVAGWIPPKALAVYLVDALGTPAWITLHRRSQAMFQDPNAFSSRQNSRPGYLPPSGAMTFLLDSLQRLIQTDTSTQYEVTIIGHSMGAIATAEVARRRDSLPIDNIVFMASAASLREFEVGVMPYLQHHDSTQFYNLTLHPLAELRESHLLRLAPYGSLLEWIDSYYSRPENDFDRMMGTYNNVVQASFMFPTEIRGRIHVKGFGYRDGTGCGPQNNLPFQHGQFNALSVPFWRPEFWHPNQIGCQAVKALAAP